MRTMDALAAVRPQRAEPSRSATAACVRSRIYPRQVSHLTSAPAARGLPSSIPLIEITGL